MNNFCSKCCISIEHYDYCMEGNFDKGNLTNLLNNHKFTKAFPAKFSHQKCNYNGYMFVLHNLIMFILKYA